MRGVVVRGGGWRRVAGRERRPRGEGGRADGVDDEDYLELVDGLGLYAAIIGGTPAQAADQLRDQLAPLVRDALQALR
jgi:hypothetical protein